MKKSIWDKILKVAILKILAPLLELSYLCER